MTATAEKTAVVETSTLLGLALNWAAGTAHGLTLELAYVAVPDTEAPRIAFVCSVEPNNQNGITKSQWSPSSNWFDTGVLVDAHIKRMGDCGEPVGGWDDLPLERRCFATTHSGDTATGPTKRVAVCRAVVLAKLGDAVEVPAVLVSQ